VSETTDSFDVAVIGAGAAGLWTALCAAELGARVCLISRKPLSESASFRAQGGLAAALEAGDSPAQHAADTIAAGRGLCRPSAVEVLVREAPAAIAELRERGVEFDLDQDGEPALGLEGGHTRRRIVHAGGSETGRELTGKLAGLVGREPRVEIRENTSALALREGGEGCRGVLTDRGDVTAPATVLAAGGAAALWERTTNPWGAIGAGCVLAQMVGAELADLEFCQFHPTALARPGTVEDGLLVTEAVRGEGAALLDSSGRRFTDELAPRDAVTAAILDRMDADGTQHVLLDLRPVDPARFPAVFGSLRSAGLDPRSEPVPVAPAAHYVMGGVKVGLDGSSTVPGLYAVGENACTGVHGANRLASNSLTECFVFGRRAAAAAAGARAHAPEPPGTGAVEWLHDHSPPAFVPPTEETRERVWRLAGPRRDASGLSLLLEDPYPLARAIAAAALDRRESRGGHLRVDAPGLDPALDGRHVTVAADGTTRRETWS
jgi:L-aspartate oxidase